MKIQLLYILSCYVAGTNINQVHRDVKMENQQCCSFPIIVQGLDKAFVPGDIMQANIGVWIDERKLELSLRKSFQGFFIFAEKKEGEYGEIVRPLQMFSKEVATTPQIKLPRLEWFSVLDSRNRIASIGSILTKTRDPQKPLNVNSFFKKNLQTLLLYTDNIPFELIINGGWLENIIPMKTSGTMASDSQLTDIYRIKKISSTTYDLFMILKFFKSIDIFEGQKCVFIDEIESTTEHVKNILIDGERATGMNAYYNKDGISYKFNIYAKAPVKIIPDSYDDFHYNKWIMRYLVFHKRQSDQQVATAEDIGKIKSILQSPIHKKVLESRIIKEEQQAEIEKELKEKRKINRERMATE